MGLFDQFFGKGLGLKLAGMVDYRWKKRKARTCYEKTLREELGTIRIIGSPDIDSVAVDLLDTFVSLRISTAWRSERQFDPTGKELPCDLDGDLSPDQVIARAFERYRMLLIIGEPGSGKTTLLKYFAMTCLKGQDERLGCEYKPIPIFFPLRETRFDGNDMPLPLSENLTHWAQQHALSIPKETFQDWLNNNHALILLDGLDEIRDIKRRIAVCDWIGKSARGLHEANFVLTSRWTGYRKADGIELDFDHLRADVRDFSPEQQAEFLDKWFRAAYTKDLSEDKDIQQLEQEARLKAQAIIDYLNRPENKAVQELAGVPMLVQIIAIIWKERDVLPGDRADLYQAAVKYLLQHRDKRKHLDPVLPASKAMRVLCPIALWMQDDLHTDEVDKQSMHSQMQPILNTIDDKITGAQFCENLRDRAGLLADYGKDGYIFRHKSFREYLAGLELLNQAREDAGRMKQIVKHLGDDWWEETLRFFIAEADAKRFNGFITALFRGGTSRDLDQKQLALLRTMTEEARQRPVDALKACLNDGRIKASKKRHILECLKIIDSKEALAAVQAFEKTAKGSMAKAAQEIVAEQAVEPVKAQQLAHLDGLFKDMRNSFRNPLELKAEYILIPGGSYIYSADKSQSPVTDLYFAKYPVTNKRYRRFIGYLRGEEAELQQILTLDGYAERLRTVAANDQGFLEYHNEGQEHWTHLFCSKNDEDKRFKGADQPVVGITQYAARAYCAWLTQLENAHARQDIACYRLPNEREWEWAAAGKAKRKYPWGKDEPTDKRANYGQKVGATTPVGSFPKGATPEGLMDMAGNVWEWMGNKHDESRPYISLRGGSWIHDVVWLRCAGRDGARPSLRNGGVGFRVVRSQS